MTCRPSLRWGGESRPYLLTHLALLREQGFHSAFAGITEPNPGSAALHESCGFIAVGTYEKVGFKNGAWLDVRWYALELTQHPVPPLPVVSVADAARTPQWQAILERG